MSDYLLEKSLLLLSSAIVSFWVVIWVMHICALVNAKMKLNKTTTPPPQPPHCHHHIAFNNTSNQNNNIITKNNFTHNNNNNNNTTQATFAVVEQQPPSSPPQQQQQPTAPPQLQPQNPLIGINDADNNNNNTKTAINETAAAAQLDSPSVEDKLLLFVDQCPTHQQNLYPNEKQHQPNRNEPQIESSPHQYSHYQQQQEKHKQSGKTNYSNHYFVKTTNQELLPHERGGIMNLCNSYVNMPLPGVSIIKPLVGVDSNLHANLETFFCMDYPVYELLFCVQDPDDAAILTVKNLFKLYPEVDAKLFTGGSCVGVNPKINNMQPAYEAVKYELLLVSDSGISMKKDTLLDMVYHMHEDVALVHQMPFVCDNKGTGFDSVVEKVYFGTAHARAYLTADLLNINCPTGMSALMRKHLLDEVGGIKAFGQYLAEDFFFAKSFTDRGWKISISSQPAWQNTANTGNTISTLNGRIQRWIKLRFAMVPHWTFLEPFSECLLLGFLGAISISFLWAIDPMAIFIFHIVIWLAFDYTLLRTIQNGPLTFSTSQFFLGWLVRESTALLIFARALANRNLVTWRSRVFRLKKGGYAEEIIPDKQNVIFYLYCGDSL